MATLPIGFFMPLPLPIMIPFMMWQSAAIAAGFGTYFQYAKRRISAMSNDEFNSFNPSTGVNEMFDDIMSNIPSSFERIRSINNLILQSLADFLEDGIRFLSGKLGGQLNTPFEFTGPPVTEPSSGGDFTPNPFTIFDPLPPAGGEHFVPPPPVTEIFGPPAPPLTQQQLLDKYANWKTYRQKGGLLTEQQWRVARRGQPGGIPEITPEQKRKPSPIGKTKHPKYFEVVRRLISQKKQLVIRRDSILNQIKAIDIQIKQLPITPFNKSMRRRLLLQKTPLIKNLRQVDNGIRAIDKNMSEFMNKFIP